MLTSARNPDGPGLLVTALRSRSAPVVRALLESNAFSLAQVHILLIVRCCRRSFLYERGPQASNFTYGGVRGARGAVTDTTTRKINIAPPWFPC